MLFYLLILVYRNECYWTLQKKQLQVDPVSHSVPHSSTASCVCMRPTAASLWRDRGRVRMVASMYLKHAGRHPCSMMILVGLRHCIVLCGLLLILAGDIELNPGPVSLHDAVDQPAKQARTATRTCSSSSCEERVSIRAAVCASCGASIKKRRGRPPNTTKANGYKVSPGRKGGTTAMAGFKTSSGRPLGTTVQAGYGVGTSGARSEGTTAEAGYSVGTSGARPKGTTAEAGYGVGTSGACPKGTTVEAGYVVGTSGTRPVGTTAEAGYSVGTSGARPVGTTAEAGYSVGTSGARPKGTTVEAGYSVGTSGARPVGTTAEAGYDVGRSGGRTKGTTVEAGYIVARSGGRPSGTSQAKGYSVGKRSVSLDMCELPCEWSTERDHLNVSDDLVARCEKHMLKQRKFDEKPLGVGLCYSCGRLLFAKTDSSHTCLVNPPDMRPEDVPATAYLRAVPNSQLDYVKVSANSSCKKWYCCSHCHSKRLPAEAHVGGVTEHNSDTLKPVSQWDMRKPEPVAALANQYEKTQTSLCAMFSTTAKEAAFSACTHWQGEVGSLHKLDRHYYGLFGFLACREVGILQNAKKPDSALRIHKALKWYHNHNHLYEKFFSTYETLFQFVKPSFINPELLRDQRMSLEDLLQDEAIAMAFPTDSKYFENYPLIYKTDAVAALQHPQSEEDTCRDSLQQLVHTKYGERFLEPKAFPHLHPWGHGGWHYACPLEFSSHVKMRLFDVRGWWAEDPVHPFFKFDLMTKLRLKAYASHRVVKVSKLSDPLSARKVREGEGAEYEPYSCYGADVPRNIPGSKQYWKSFGLDLVAFAQQRGLPDYFLTLSVNDCWPQTQAALCRGWGADPSETLVNDIAGRPENRQPVGWKPMVSVLAPEKRFQWFMKILLSDNGPLGFVEDYVWKKEYQKRGAVHWHMLLWITPGTAPKESVMAEIPRHHDCENKVAAYLRKVVLKMQQHGQCIPTRCFKGSGGKKLSQCKYGFPFDVPRNKEELDDEGIRYLYVRRCIEDAMVVPYNPEIAVLWGASHNVQKVSRHGFEEYLAKYVSKSEPSVNISLPENASDPQRYLRTRVVGAVEALEVLCGFQQHRMTRQVIFLPSELNPNQRMLKNRAQLEKMD